MLPITVMITMELSIVTTTDLNRQAFDMKSITYVSQDKKKVSHSFRIKTKERNLMIGMIQLEN